MGVSGNSSSAYHNPNNGGNHPHQSHPPPPPHPYYNPQYSTRDGNQQSSLPPSTGVQQYENSNIGASLNTSFHSTGSTSSIRSSGNHHPSQKPSGSGKNLKKHMPVMYRLSWSASSPAMTITLLVPKRVPVPGSNNNKSPFTKVGKGSARYYDENGNLVDEDDDDQTQTSSLSNDQHSSSDPSNNGSNSNLRKKIMDIYSLRIPLSYFLQLASNKKNENGVEESSYPGWLDRQTLRARLNGGGRAIGLDPPYLYRAVSAVEESALHLPEWVPIGTENVTVEVVMGGGTQDGWVQCEASVAISGGNGNNGSAPTPSVDNRPSVGRMESPPLGSGNINPAQNPSSSVLVGSSSSYAQPQSQQHQLMGSGMLLGGTSIMPPGVSVGSNTFSSNHPQLYQQHYAHHQQQQQQQQPYTSFNSNAFGYSADGNKKTTAPGFGNIGSSQLHLGQQNQYNQSLAMFSQSSSIWPASSSSSNPGWHSTLTPATPAIQENISTNSTNVNRQNQAPLVANATAASAIIDGSFKNETTTELPSSNQSSKSVESVSSKAEDNTSNFASGTVSSQSSTKSFTYQEEKSDSSPAKTPDPASIMAPLLSMGFTERQCLAAIRAIQYLDQNDGNGSSDEGEDKDAIVNINDQKSRKSRLASFTRSDKSEDGNAYSSLGSNELVRQISGEDIVDFILSGDSLKSRSATNNNNLNISGVSSVPSTASDDDELDDVSYGTGQQYMSNENVSSNNVWESNTTSEKNSKAGTSANAASSMSNSSTSKQSTPTVWGNAGKLKLVKSISTGSAAPSGSNKSANQTTAWSNAASANGSGLLPNSSHTTSAQSSTPTPQATKMIKVLDVPQDINAFVFHCNAQTREECLERRLFGCPSGGQYGPHSKAKANDLLFLADFSAWTVTGIFTAKSDAALNIEKDAWNGRFPWQIRVYEWQHSSSLRTIHIDRVNEILGLASGSKLNMLTKDQLIKLVSSKEFAQVVPPSLYKMKPAPAPLPTSTSVVNTSANHSSNAAITGQSSSSSNDVTNLPSVSSKVVNSTGNNTNHEVVAKNVQTSSSLPSKPSKISTTDSVQSNGNQSNLGSDEGIKFHQQPQFHQFQSSNYHDEHPATAMHRVKLVSAWFDSTANDILTLNETFHSNIKKAASQSSITKKDRNLCNDLNRFVYKGTGDADAYSWPLMTFNHIRNGLGDIFDQWLFQAHAVGNDEGRGARFIQLCKNGDLDPAVHTPFDESGSWTRQGRSGSSSSRNKREDPMLLSHVPGSVEHIKILLQDKDGSTALAIPDDELAEVLANKFVRELEQISVEVRKTQSALVRIGGEDYLKSVEDKMLGMRLSEVTTKYYDEDGETVEKTIMRIEWHTKSSIAQGRPPQVQKIYKTHFDMLSKNYREYSSGTDPELKHILTRMFVLLCRYDLVGDMKNGCNVSLTSTAFETLTKQFGVTHECFASPMNHVCPSYNSIFPDIDRYFGSLGSFFDFVPKEGSFELDIPFNGSSAKITLDHILGLLYQSDSDKHPLSFIVIVPDGEDILEYAQNSPFLRKTAILEADDATSGATFTLDVQYKDASSSTRKMSRNADEMDAPNSNKMKLFLWLQNDFGHDLWTPTVEKVQNVVNCFNSGI